MKDRTLKLSLDSILALDTRNDKSSFFEEVAVNSERAVPRADIDLNLTRINQVVPKLASDEILEPLADVTKEKKARAIAEYFKKNPLSHLKNFPKTKKIFLDFFDNLDTVEQDVDFLSEELDKQTSSTDQYGKVIITALYDAGNPAVFKLQIFRPLIEGVKQFFVFDLSHPDDSGKRFQTVTQSEKSKRLTINRSLKSFNKASKHPYKSTVFDAEIWKGFIQDKIEASHYDMVMDCLERSHIHIQDFIRLVNSRDKKYFKFLYKDYLKNVSIRTNSKDTSFINFKTASNQQIEFKLNKYALSFQI